MTDLIKRDDALLPCPFCGGEAELQVGEECAYVQCLNIKMHCGPFIDGDNNAAAEAIAAWNTRALPAVTVGVKPLVWEAGERDQRRADSILGEFVVTFFGGRWLYQGEPCNGMLDAQAAAQADYEARILAALTPAPVIDPAAVTVGVKPLRYFEPEGSTVEQMRDHARQHPLAQEGDMKLVWINEGDLSIYLLAAMQSAPVADSQPAVHVVNRQTCTFPLCGCVAKGQWCPAPHSPAAIREAAIREVLALRRLGQDCFDTIEVMKDGWLIHEDDVEALIGEKK